MSVYLEFINLIVPIEIIEQHYPGGFAKFKQDNKSYLGGRIWFDEYIVRDGAMNPIDMEFLAKSWKQLGLSGIAENDGNKFWKDMCIVDTLKGPTLPCDWLIHKQDSACHIQDHSSVIIGRGNFQAIQISNFNPTEWLRNFRIASASLSGFRELRADIFQQTVFVVQNGGYHLHGDFVSVENKGLAENTSFFIRPKSLNPANTIDETVFSVLQADCLECAELLTKAGYNPCVLNMANRQNPGGGVLGGAGAQEENIFRRSNLFLSLYQFVDYCDQYGIPRNTSNSYPLDRDTGGIYSKDVTVFRGSEKSGYCFLKKPFKISIVSVPAINKPQLEHINGQCHISRQLVEPSKEKIRTVLRISGQMGHDCLVLGAFGCGAFCNPPHHMATLFKEVFNEKEFLYQFKLVVFAILDDHNTRKEHNPDGNFIPFLREFEK